MHIDLSFAGFNSLSLSFFSETTTTQVDEEISFAEAGVTNPLAKGDKKMQKPKCGFLNNLYTK